MDSRRKMTVRTLKDCRLVIVIFSSSCVKKGGSRREGGREEAVCFSWNWASFACWQLLSHGCCCCECGLLMRTGQAERAKRFRCLIRISGSSTLWGQLVWWWVPTIWNLPLGLHNWMAWPLTLIEISAQVGVAGTCFIFAEIPVVITVFLILTEIFKCKSVIYKT